MTADDTMSDYWADVKADRKERRAKYGIPCQAAGRRSRSESPPSYFPSSGARSADTVTTGRGWNLLINLETMGR